MSISLAFFVLASLLLWFIIGSKGRWSVKALVIACVLYSCLSINLSLDNLFGWPSNQSMPEAFQVHWIKIKDMANSAAKHSSVLNRTSRNAKLVWYSLFIF